MTAARVDSLRLIGSFGSGNVMAGELSRLVRRARPDVPSLEPRKDGSASIVYAFDPRVAAIAVRYHRTSARVLWELYHSRAARLEPLYADLRSLVQSDERRWLWAGARISVETHFVEAFAAGERQVVGTVKNAIVDGAAERGFELTVDAERPDIVIDVRMRAETVVVAVDLAGRPMHQRGYRHRAGDAPLREDVAAFLVMLSHYDCRKDVLVDPMAGAGTLAIEAACIASGRAVWCSGRAPLGDKLPALAEHLAGRAPPLFAGARVFVAMNERDEALASVAESNARTAGVEPNIAGRTGDFRSWSSQEVFQAFAERGYDGPPRGVILCNPPYGHRLGDPAKLRRLYSDLGDWCRAFQGFRAGFVVANPDFPRAFGFRPRAAKPVRNGAIKATFYSFDL